MVSKANRRANCHKFKESEEEVVLANWAVADAQPRLKRTHYYHATLNPAVSRHRPSHRIALLLQARK